MSDNPRLIQITPSARQSTAGQYVQHLLQLLNVAKAADIQDDEIGAAHLAAIHAMAHRASEHLDAILEDRV